MRRDLQQERGGGGGGGWGGGGRDDISMGRIRVTTYCLDLSEHRQQGQKVTQQREGGK